MANTTVERNTTHVDTSNTFIRVQGAYDLHRMARARVIYVGVGGARAFVEQLARAGVGSHVLIDPDIVSETNIATQDVFRSEIGRSKVECIHEHILDINPNAQVLTYSCYLDDLTDNQLEQIINLPIDGAPPEVVIICGLTDNFEAQARVNRIALQYSIPSLCAQVYREGRGAEITFTHPKITPACHRCILSSRYKAYLHEDFKNDVTADGTPIFSTTRLNALKGFVALAILHHRMDPYLIPPGFMPHGSAFIEKPSYKRWGKLLERIGNRNLIQIRMDPDFSSTIGLKVFDRVFGAGDQERILFDEAVWLPQKQECPATGYDYHCPDCGGTGNLQDAAGKFADTRTMLR